MGARRGESRKMAESEGGAMGNSQQFLFCAWNLIMRGGRAAACEWMSKGDDIARLLNLVAGIFLGFWR